MPCNMVHKPSVHVPVQVYLPGSSNWSIPDIEFVAIHDIDTGREILEARESDNGPCRVVEPFM